MAAAPYGAACKTLAIGLNAGNRIAGQLVAALLGFVAAETHDDLVEHHVIEYFNAGFGGKHPGHDARNFTVALHHGRNAAAAQMPDHGPSCKATGAARKFRHIVRGITLTFGGERQIARGNRHGAPVGQFIADNRIAAVIGGLQPLVAIGCPRIGAFKSRGEVAGCCTGAGPQTEGAIDMQPGAGLFCERDNLFKFI